MKTLYTITCSLMLCFVLLAPKSISAQTVLFDQTISQISQGGCAETVGSDGNYYLGTSNHVSCYSPSGMELWSLDLQVPGLGIGYITEVDSGLVLAGGLYNTGVWSIFMLQLDLQHNVEWMHVYERGANNYTQLHDVCHTSDGEFVIAAYALSTGPFLMKTDAQGVPIWVHGAGSPQTEMFRTVQETSDHTILVGCTSSTVLAFDTAGTLLWQHAYHEGAGFYKGSITATSEVPGGYLIAGNILHPSQVGSAGFKIIRTDFSGNMLSHATYDDTTATWNVRSNAGCAVKDSGMLLILERDQNFSGGQVIGGLCFIDTAGSMRWTRQYTSLWSVYATMVDTGLVLLGGSDVNPNTYGFLKTDPNGVGLCPTAGIPLVHGPSLIDTSFNLIITSISVSDTMVTFIVPVADSLFTFPNCIAADVAAPVLRSDLAVYPNPVTGNSITIEGTNATGIFRLYDQLGQVVFTTTIASSPCTVQLPSHLSSGLYIAEVESGDAVSRTRVMVSSN